MAIRALSPNFQWTSVRILAKRTLTEFELQLILLFYEKRVLSFLLLELGLTDLQVSVDAGDLAQLLVKDVLELVLKLTLLVLVVFSHLEFELLFLFLEVFHSLVENLNVQF